MRAFFWPAVSFPVATTTSASVVLTSRARFARMSKVALGPKFETLVHDWRLDKVYLHLSRLVKFPDGLGFRTQIQPAIKAEDPMGPQSE